MTELEKISAAWSEALKRGENGVLATVVRVEGSTYRRAGARLLLSNGGQRVGSVSGGCLEADLAKKAWWLTQQEESVIREYDTSGESGVAQEFGLGCNGVIRVLLERLNDSAAMLRNAIQFVRQHRQPVLAATVIEDDPERALRVGQRWLQYPDGTIQTDIENAAVLASLQLAASQGRYSGNHVTAWRTELQAANFFMEVIQPSLRLLVFGAGDDTIPMVQLARFMGYQTVVLDGRSHLARPDRFPLADDVQVVDSDNMLGSIQMDKWTVALLMSHSYLQDLAALRALSQYELPYLGLLGPRKRTEQMLFDAGLSSGQFDSIVHSPMGLDIGADGAEQISLATIAEIQSVLNQRTGGQLHKKAGPLHVHSIEDPRWSENSTAPLSCPMSV